MQMDMDNNGCVDRQEMERFLTKKNINEKYREEIIDKLFQDADLDRNGTIQLDEFVELYWQTKNQLVEKEDELKRLIISLNRNKIAID